jgi:hypothetical protein
MSPSIGTLVVSVVLFIACLVHAYFKAQRLRRKRDGEQLIGFFHPYCNHGGGGERVLWLMIAALLNQREIGQMARIQVYTGDRNLRREDLITNAEVGFGIILRIF